MKHFWPLIMCAPALAQNVAQPWHEPYVGQLVECKPDPLQKNGMLAVYTFDGSSVQTFQVKKDPGGCLLRITITPRPVKPAPRK
jgi:hypothetical protein